MTAEPTDAAFWEAAWRSDPFGAVLGYRIALLDRTAHEARVELTIGERHLSPSGKVHGGVLTSLFDAACGAAVCTTMAKADRCSTVEIKVNFFRPVTLGEDLEVTARVVFRGRKLCALMAMLLRKGGDEPVAMATATFNIVESRDITAEAPSRR